MVSRIIKVAATTIATLSLASAASAGCGNGLYCGDAGASTSSAWSSHGSSYDAGSTYWAPSSSSSYSTTMSSGQADATYGTGSISQTYTGAASDTYGFHGSTQGLAGLGANESLQATNCPVNVYGAGDGQVLGCYNVVKPVPQTTYYRVVRPIVYVRYPVPVAVPYYSPCHTYKIHSRYGDFHNRGYKPAPRCS